MFLKRRGAQASNFLTVGVDGRFLQDKFHGIGRYAYGLLTGLCALEGDFKIVVFVDPSLPNKRFPLDDLSHTGKIVFQDIRIPLYGPQEIWAWPAALHHTPVDVFHSPYFWSPLVLPCPLVVTVHDMIFDRYPQYIPGLRYLVPYRVTSRLVLRNASRVIAVSEATKRDIVCFGGADEHKIVAVEEGADPMFHPITDAHERTRVLEKYGLPDSYVLALGTRRPHKNIARLVSAFARIALEVPQSLALAGAIDDRFVDQAADDIAVLKRAGRVVEMPYVEEQDLPVVYSMADLFVQPSIIEGFGLPVLEAMACGCPVACSNTSSLPEVAGDAAALFDPRSEEDMGGVLQNVLQSANYRRDLRQSGLSRVGNFTWEKAARKTLDVYHAAASTATMGEKISV